jgi:N-methylhydantoinase A
LTRSHRVGLDAADFNEIETLFQNLASEGAAILQKTVHDDTLRIERTLMMRFVGQGAETDLALENRPFQEWKISEIRQLFDQAYEKLYGRTYPETQIEFVTFKVRVSEPERPFRLPRFESQSGQLADALKGTRPAFSLTRKMFLPHDVYDRMKLFSGAAIQGPAIIEERESTIVIGEDASCSVDSYGFVWIEI